MIAGKMKTAIYTLIAVILIASTAAGCTVTEKETDNTVSVNEGSAAATELPEMSQQSEIAVAVDYASEEIFESGLAYTFTADNSEYAANVLFSAKKAVTDFKLLTINLENIDDDGNIRFSAAGELYSLPELTPEKPLAVRMTFEGSIPDKGISYVDASGTKQTYAVTMSGKDGSVIFVEADIDESQKK